MLNHSSLLLLTSNDIMSREVIKHRKFRMKKLLLALIALATTSPIFTKQCCKEKNPHCCDTHKICPAGTSEPCEGACLPDQPKIEVITKQTPHHKKAHRKPVKKHKKHSAHHKHAKKHHETTVN